MKYNLLLIIILFFSCKNNSEKNVEIKKSVNNEVVHKSNNYCQKFHLIKWNEIRESREFQQTTYINDFYSLDLKNFLNEQENKGGVILFVNNKKIDTIINDFSHKPIIFGCKKNKKILIFIEELDESGVIGYRVYFNANKDFVYSGFLNISSVEDTLKFNDNFIRLTVEDANKIQMSIIPKLYFNTSNYKNDLSSNFKAFILINSGKLIIDN